MPVPSSISQLSQTAGSNSPAGSESPNTADDYLRTYAAYIAMHRDGAGFTQEATVASAATADIGAATSLMVNITGTTTITSFGTNYNGPRFVRFAGALTLTHNASTLILPGAANLTTAAGDSALVVPVGNPASGWRVAAYTVAAVAPGAVADGSVTTAKLAVAFTLPIANGGTGQTTAAAAFNAIKQAASDTATGVVELATTAEAAAGTDTTRAITPAGLFGGLNASGTAPIYACRAWVNFNGAGTVAIRASGNCSSITDNGAGDFTMNFATAMPDFNYAALITVGGVNGIWDARTYEDVTARTTTALRISVVGDGSVGNASDPAQVGVVAFR